MSEGLQSSGQCLCGAVTVQVQLQKASFDACHCNMCRRWGGGPLLAVDAKDGASFDGADNISVFASSHWAERGFCKHCGTHLFYRLKGGQHYSLPLGLIEGELSWTFNEQIFIDEKPAWYDFANETCNLTAAEAIEKYGGR
jgi:hypothetical protein